MGRILNMGYGIFFLYLSVFWLLLLPVSGYAQPVAWGGGWRTLSSEHFEIHFQEGLQEMALRCLSIAEGVREELLLWFRSAPQGPVHMVLSDETDFANGWATPLPFAQIRLFVPNPEDAGSLEHYDEWMHILIRHEYAHILHMELGQGVVSMGRRILGRFPLLFPHALTPTFLLEGVAVYLETDSKAGYGRLQGSHYAAMMRLEVEEGHWKDMQEVVTDLRKWPLGKAYLYGAFFVEYLVSEYGEEAVVAFLHRQSGELIPFFTLQAQARRVFGKSFSGLWQDFRKAMEIRFGEEAVSAEARDHRILPSGNLFLQVAAAREDDFFLVKDNGQDRRELLHYGGDGVKAWMRVRPLRDLSVAEDGRLAASRLVSRPDGRMFHDIFLHTPSEGWKRLTHGMRFHRVRWLAGGRQLLAVRQVSGRSELHLVDLEGKNRLLWRGESGCVLGALDPDPEGLQVVASVKRAGQGWNLEILDLRTLTWQPLTQTLAMENEPSFLPDGRILFSADYDGRYEIHVLDPRTGATEQWTQTPGGAFRPRWAGRQGLMFQTYTAQGYRLIQIQHPKVLKTFSRDFRMGLRDYPLVFQEPVKGREEKAYTPWSSLRPRYWFPVWLFDDDTSQLGFLTSGSDALGRHAYTLQATWDVKNDLANGRFTYVCDNRWSLMLERSHGFSRFSWNGESLDLRQQKDRATLQRNHALYFLENRVAVHAGMVHERDTWIRAWPGMRLRDVNTNLVGLGITFQDEEFYLETPGVGWGMYADLVVESHDLLPGDYKGPVVQGQIRKTWDLPGRSTLEARLAGGYADKEGRPFHMGGVRIWEEGRLFGRDEATLRGYPRSVQWGNVYAAQRLTFYPWLYRMERNLSLMPLGLGDISAGVFVDSGSAWEEGESMRQLTGAGLELRMELVLGYRIVAPLILGYARGLDSDLGENQFYTLLGFSF
ncbi:hypothetical protein [Desulfobotulus sp.]|uniref:hypothetical protein n=1 Tax=Desulfobotulus sp. TaxID=1940337 RepID=UPI002A36CD09|nr:hypothetical protein [Desulfobotulus sp.]MDY0161645.1 hypothetical protein [Desulfobotulus sp.]